MMQPIRTADCNMLLGAPKDWNEATDGECAALPVHRNGAYMHSFWRPNEQEIANILAGMPIRLTIVGGAHPPVAINVTDSVLS